MPVEVHLIDVIITCKRDEQNWQKRHCRFKIAVAFMPYNIKILYTAVKFSNYDPLLLVSCAVYGVVLMTNFQA